MGTVWAGEHTLLGRRAAIKLIHRTYSRNEMLVRRFFNEAKAVAAIADPGIVQVFDFGVHSDGSPYIVMELLDGETLETRLRRADRLAPDAAIRLMRQVAMSLAVAHKKGVIHRDLKPENLLTIKDPAIFGGERVKVLDFGIAKLSQGGGKHKTQVGMMLGTPAYMSPEQCRGLDNIDHRSDIYSLGAVLFCLVTGRPPFESKGDSDALFAHVRDLPPMPSSIFPGVSAGLNLTILRCLEKDPGRRYQEMSELADALAVVEVAPRVHAVSLRSEDCPAAPDMPGSTVTATLLSRASTTISAAPGEVAFSRQATGRVHALRQGRPGRSVVFAGVGAGSVAIWGVLAFVVPTGDGSSSKIPDLAPKRSPAPAVAVKPTSAAQITSSTSAVAARPSLASMEQRREPEAEIIARTRDVLTRFTSWSRDHQGAPCPDIGAFGDSPPDPWGGAFRLTCVEQPSDQIIGVISAGPDRVPRTSDDIVSWKLGNDVTDLVRGSRWGVIVLPTIPPANSQIGRCADAKRRPVCVTPRTEAGKPRDVHSAVDTKLSDTPEPVDAIPPGTSQPEQTPHSDEIELDAFGIPITRKQ